MLHRGQSIYPLYSLWGSIMSAGNSAHMPPAITPDYEQLVARLRPFGQQHLVAFWDRLDNVQRRRLAAEIAAIDFALVARLVAEAPSADMVRALAARAKSPPAIRLGHAQNRFSSSEARQRGQAALAQGEIGAMLVAGGQGSRLGFSHPKGMYPIGPVSGKTLFQLHAEKVRAVSRRYGALIPLYVMTSPATHEATVEFFQRHRNFGLGSEEVVIFCQGTMPAVDAATGKILLEQPDHVALSPDGHGGMLAAAARARIFDDCRRRGIEHLFYFQVDNPLVDVCGPEFLGYHLLAASEMTTQVIAKRFPTERVGNVVEVEGRLYVIEYSDLPDDVAERRGPDGSLLLWAGSIAVHAFSVAFLERMAAQADSLPFHRARKKVPYVDLATGTVVHPAEANAIKFERFIFDLMPAARNALVVEVDAARQFAPLKNASGQGQDTPESVRAQMAALYAEWLEQAGVTVDRGVPVEISPLWALDAEEVVRRTVGPRRITQPTYFGDSDSPQVASSSADLPP